MISYDNYILLIFVAADAFYSRHAFVRYVMQFWTMAQIQLLHVLYSSQSKRDPKESVMCKWA